MIKQDFNHEWRFREGLDNPMTSAFVGSNGQTVPVSLPHDAMLASKRSAANTEESGIGYFTPENVEYEKEFAWTEDDQGKVVYLEFEGIYANAVLEVNGCVVTRHRFGFTGFVARIDDQLKVGKNKIKVSVLNGLGRNGRYYTGTGIYRDVKLMVGDPLHIAPDGIQLTTLDADSDMASVEVAATIQHSGMGHRKARFELRLMDAEGNECGVAGTTVHLVSNDEQRLRLMLYVPKPQLWSPETPDLYRYEAVILEEKYTTDSVSGSFGIRKLQLDPVHGLRINGRAVKLKGGCIHGDNAFIGAVSVADAENRRVSMLKAAGYNALRTAHNPVSHALLDACDRYGMLVLEEYADAWTHSKPAFDYSMWMEDCWKADIDDMVRVAYNHPSVIMYSIGNEISDVGSELSAVWGRRFANRLRRKDPTRLITNGINVMMANLDKIGLIAKNMGYGDFAVGEINNMMAEIGAVMGAIVTHPISLNAIEESCALLDVIGYNYAAHMYERDHGADSNRILMGSETNPCDLDKNWELVEKHSYVLGDFAWTCWDYLGEPGIGRIEEKKEGFNVYAAYPWLAAYCGDFDLTGYRRPVSYWREIVWGGRKHMPYIAVQRPENLGKNLSFSQWSWTDSVHSWTWPGWEGKEIVVEVYSDAEEVELYLNSESLGIKVVGTDEHRCYCKWNLFYEPGTLEAVARIRGKEVGREILSSAERAGLTVKADKLCLKACSSDLSFVDIEYRDDNGTLDYYTPHVVTFRTEGNIKLAGSGSADPKTEESYLSDWHSTFEGRAIAVIQAEEAGEGKLIVTDETGDKVILQYIIH